MTPDFTVFAEGADITRQIKDRLLALSVTDEAGIKSDEVEIVLDDRDGLIELPRPGAHLAVALGHKETGLVPMGIYVSDEVTISSPPAQLTIRAKAADLGGDAKDQKTRGWDGKTIGDIVSTIAAEHALTPKISAAYKDVRFDHLDQTEESDISFLDRLARELDALASIKGGSLLFIGRGEGKTASGLPVPPTVIRQQDVTNWTLTLTTRTRYASVTAYWHDKNAAKRIAEIAGSGTPTLKLRHVHASQEEAAKAARAKLDEITRGNDSLELTLPGNPLLAAETRILTTGFRAGVSGLWSVTTVSHDLTSSGYSCTVSCERPKGG